MICEVEYGADVLIGLPLHSSIRTSMTGRWDVMSSRTQTSPIRLLRKQDTAMPDSNQQITEHFKTIGIEWLLT